MNLLRQLGRLLTLLEMQLVQHRPTALPFFLSAVFPEPPVSRCLSLKPLLEEEEEEEEEQTGDKVFCCRE